MEASAGFRIGALLNIPTLVLRSRAFEALRSAGFGDVTPSLQPVMMLVAPEGSRITTLALQAGMTKQSMGYLVSQLEGRGYLERQPDPSDRRAQLVRRTARGWAYNDAVTAEVAAIEGDWARVLGRHKFNQLKVLLSDLSEALGVHYESSAAELAHRRGS